LSQKKRGELENLLTGLTMPLFVLVSKEEGRLGKPFNWFNHASKGFPTLPSSFETSTKRGMVKPVKRFSNPPLFF
jgi:hypothetical protein